MGAMRRSSAAHGIVACAAILQLSAVLAPATGHSLSPRAPAGTEAGQPFIPARRSILVSDQRKSLRYTQPGLNGGCGALTILIVGQLFVALTRACVEGAGEEGGGVVG